MVKVCARYFGFAKHKESHEVDCRLAATKGDIQMGFALYVGDK